jgi:hypothetical protein
MSVVEDAVNNGMGDGGIAEGFAPLFKGNAGGKNHGKALVTCADQVQKKTGIFRFGSDEVHAVDDQEVGTCDGCDGWVGGVICQCGIEKRKDLLELEEEYPITCLTRFDAQGLEMSTEN